MHHDYDQIDKQIEGMNVSLIYSIACAFEKAGGVDRIGFPGIRGKRIRFRDCVSSGVLWFNYLSTESTDAVSYNAKYTAKNVRTLIDCGL